MRHVSACSVNDNVQCCSLLMGNYTCIIVISVQKVIFCTGDSLHQCCSCKQACVHARTRTHTLTHTPARECFFLLLLLFRHAPLHYVVLYAGFALIYVYMIRSCGGFLILVVRAFVLRPFSLQFFEIYGVCEHCELF